MHIRAALFDMDGTIFDSRIDWVSLRERIRIPWDGRAILAQLIDAPADVREEGLALLHEAEREGAENGSLIAGTEELLGFLRAQAVRCALITNNSRRSVDTVCGRYPLPFDLVLTRDDVTTKPEPEGFLRALAAFGVEPQEAVAIGDAHLDLIAAHRAGIDEIVLVATPARMAVHIPRDIAYRAASDLFEVQEIVRRLLDGDAR